MNFIFFGGNTIIRYKTLLKEVFIMFTRNPIKFMFEWEVLKSRGKKNFVFKRGVLINEVIFSILYITYFIVFESIIFKKSSFKNFISIYGLGMIIICFISYLCFSIVWKYNSKRFLKLKLKNISEKNNKISIIEKIKE